MDTKGGGDTIILKVVVPSDNVSKTIRLPPRTLIKDLHQPLSKKLASMDNVQPSAYDDYAFCGLSESGPLWLADKSTLRAYNLKNNVCISRFISLFIWCARV